MKHNWYYAMWQLMLLFVTLALLAISYYFEYMVGLSPCPLCIMQRVCITLLAGVIVFNIRFNSFVKAKRKLIIQLCIIGFGMFFSGRQMWMQHFAVSETATCLPGIAMMLHYFPWQDIVYSLIWGGSDCAE